MTPVKPGSSAVTVLPLMDATRGLLIVYSPSGRTTVSPTAQTTAFVLHPQMAEKSDTDISAARSGIAASNSAAAIANSPKTPLILANI